MAKSYYITYGSTSSKQITKDLLEEKLGIHLTPISGEDFGYRDGSLAETISVTNHYEEFDDWWEFPEKKEFITLVTASITQGREIDKLDRFNKLIELFEKAESLTQLRKEVLD